MTTISSTDSAVRRLLEPPLAAFECLEKAASVRGSPWLRSLRTSGISYFAELGYPSAAQEEWRFSNPALLAEFPFQPTISPSPDLPSAAALDSFGFPALRACRLVFVDGQFVSELSTLPPLPSGVILGSLSRAVTDHAALVESALGRAARHETDAFAALNTAFIQDGAFVHIPPGLTLDTPVHLLFVASRHGVVIQPRNLILARAQSSLHVIEDYVSLTDGAGFTNSVTEILAGRAARVEHVKLQRENLASLHVATIEARQHRDSQVLSHSLSLGARFARNNIHLRFEGEGANSLLNGLYLASGEQLVDHHTLADHATPHCSSHEFYHGILGGHAKGVFNGKIVVRQDAQKTDAKQTNRNLLLSREATIHTKPQLEILADDVKCTHGATVGQLDEEAVFYLRSRGLSEPQARQMLIGAFAGAVLNRLEVEPIRAEIEGWLTARLAQLHLTSASAHSRPTHV
jgi:Fe-S cluster assembly protein SufD